MKATHEKLTVIILFLAVLLLLSSCAHTVGEKEYLDDLYIDIPDTQYQLLIKEWRYLLGSGAEVYFVPSSGEQPQFLGNLTGGDDGFCPFQNGKYHMSYTEGVVCLSWSSDGSDVYSKNKSFALSESPE